MEIEIMYIEYQWKRFMSNKTIKNNFYRKTNSYIYNYFYNHAFLGNKK